MLGRIARGGIQTLRRHQILQNVVRRSFTNREEVIDFRKPDRSDTLLGGPRVTCLVIHPVLIPNKGPIKELYYAEEGVGLVKSLGWIVPKGPYWREEEEDKIKQQRREAYEKEAAESENNKKEKIREGDYIHTPWFKGTYYQGGVILDFSGTSSDEEGDVLFHEWRNVLLRQSLAKSSMVKVRSIKGKTFFGKGKVLELGEFIRSNGINAVFVNTELSTTQARNLSKMWTSIIKGENPEPNTYEDKVEKSATQVQEDDFRIKVFDRFTIILQIFAKRAKSKIAKLQIELAFLHFLKTNLIRGVGSTYSSMWNIFNGDLMRAQEINLEVVSAKQRAGGRFLAGEGETQLEIERRIIHDKEAKIRRELIQEQKTRAMMRQKRHSGGHHTLPYIAIVGYTNAGKSALLNALLEEEVAESADLLFQTLSTLARKIRLKSGLKGLLLDTIGFISHLPHDLVESFKSTLEEVAHADLVLHVRDISHPNTDDQKATVIKVLKELQFPESFYTTRMIEVWNKIDLLEKPLNYDEIKQSEMSIVPVSAMHGTNIEKLLDVISEKTNEVMGKRRVTLKYPATDHQDRFGWLLKNANITNSENFHFNPEKTKEFPHGSITIEVLLDDVTHRRYIATFESHTVSKRRRDEPPEDWNTKKK